MAAAAAASAASPSLQRDIHSLLQDCMALRDIQTARALQDRIQRNGPTKHDPFLFTNLIRLFDLCGSLQEAVQAFGKISQPSIFAWCAIILAHANHGESMNAIKLFYQMQRRDVCPNSYAFVASLKACSHMEYPYHGMLIHSESIVKDLDRDLYVTNSLINMYVNCGSINDAERVFERSRNRSVTTWSSMIKGYGQYDRIEEAFFLFNKMQTNGIMPNNVTFICILKACKSSDTLGKGKIIHDHVKRSCYASDEMIANTLIGMYMQCGSVNDAIHVFDGSPKNSIITWNAMISGYFQHGLSHEALKLFERMQPEGVNPNKVTFASILKACANTFELERGRKAYMQLIMNGTRCDAFVESTLLDMYLQCGDVKDAFGIFDKLAKRELVTWCTMISGLVHHEHNLEAFSLLCKMQEQGIDPNEITFVSILKACSNAGSVDDGRSIHNFVLESGFDSNDIVSNALIDMYAKSDSIEDARIVFDKSANRDVIAWNAMINGYAEQGLDEAALQLFGSMQLEEKKATTVTFMCALKACSNMTSLMLGRLIHFYIVECSSEYKNVLVGNMLINMYARCESFDDAVVVFMSLQNPNEFSWGAIIVGCAQCGHYDLSLKYLDGMQAKGFILSEPLFVCLLSACCHAGMVDEAFQHLNSMEEKYGITPTIDHFYCIMDLLARTGCLMEAEDILQTVPFGTDSMGWSTVLSHCNTYGNVGIGSRSFDNLALLDHRHASGYVLMSNIYVNASMWEEVEKVQGLRASAHAWKKPGRAVIEIRSQVYEFCVADDSKFHNTDIHSLLKRLSIRLKENAYMPGIDFIMYSPVMQRKMPSLFNEE